MIIHEIGHSVGLLHSDVPDSVMTPFYRSPQRNQFKFSYDDIEGIQRLYGKIIVTFVHNLPIYKDNSTLFITYSQRRRKFTILMRMNNAANRLTGEHYILLNILSYLRKDLNHVVGYRGPKALEYHNHTHCTRPYTV